MSKLFCGIDFGTSNSSVAVADENGVRVLELDPRNDSPRSLPSLLYISRHGERIVGRDAATAFIERNVDREVVLKQVDLGVAIESYVGSEPDKSETYRPREDGAEIREAVRAHAMVEVDSPGRLFQSIKSSLRYRGHKGTEVFGTLYQLEELTAMILQPIKQAVDELAGEPVETAVFGRPVRFSEREEEDALAERRLSTAARLAGFKDVVFFYEPVAACIEYATSVEERQRLMVVDIGGGTCDVCIMEFGGAHGTAERLAESRILGVSGVPVAGDAIDREILRAKIFPRLGSRARFGPNNLPMPQYIFRSISDWQNLYKLNTEETINWLLATEAHCDQPEAIRALRGMIRRNYGYPVVREVEAAKKRLSLDLETRIEIHKEEIQISEHLERAEFAHIIEHSLGEMHRSILEAESAAGIRPDQVDRVLTTGGTSLVPAVRLMLEERFGRERLLPRDTFTSVATGLAVVAQYTT